MLKKIGKKINIFTVIILVFLTVFLRDTISKIDYGGTSVERDVECDTGEGVEDSKAGVDLPFVIPVTLVILIMVVIVSSIVKTIDKILDPVGIIRKEDGEE